MFKKMEFREKFALSQLGIVFAIFFLILHILMKRSDNLYPLLSLGILIITVFCYRLLVPINKLWLGLGNLLGRIVGSVLLGLIFFLFLTPLSFLRGLFGRKGMNIDFDGKEQSFWIERKERTMDCTDFERQF